MAVKGYTTEEFIEAEIGKAITTTTTPTTAQVTQWIEEAENYIDRRCNTSFTSVTQTDEVYPWNSDVAFIKPAHSPYYGNVQRTDYGLSGGGNAFNLGYAPIISMTSLSLNSAGSTSADSWTAKTEQTGSGGDYAVDLSTGAVLFLNCVPTVSERSIKTTFVYGHATIPAIVETLATKMVARRVIDMKVKKSAFTSTDSVSLASLSIKKELRDNVEYLSKLDSDIEGLFGEVGELYSIWV